MTRFESFLQKFAFSSAKWPQTLICDIGSSNTRVRIGNKVVFNEPTCVAFHRATGQLIAVGQTALDMMGKTPASIAVVRPVQRAKIAEIKAMEIFVLGVLKKILPASFFTYAVFRPQVVFASPPGMIVTEEEVNKSIFYASGCSKVSFSPKSLAICRHLAAQKKLPKVFMLLDIGGMTTEMSFFSQGEVVQSTSIPIGGEDLTQMVQQVIRSECHCEVGWQTAEKVKKQIGGIGKESKEGKQEVSKKQTVVRGRDVLSSLPTTVHVTADKCTAMFDQLMEELLRGIQEVCQDTPPELITEALDQGIFLTGGGSILPGIGQYLETHLKSPVTLSSSPMEDVIRGL
jgi:rod shape-determining protein MreB